MTQDPTAIEGCAADDPERCQGIIANGQCSRKSVPNSKYCRLHGANMDQAAAAKAATRNYRLTTWKAKVNRQADSSSIKSLREEVGILRVLIEERLNSVETHTDLMLQSGPISDLIMRVDVLVRSCHKLDQSLGALLDKATLVQFASNIVMIIGEALPGQEDLIDDISHKIMAAAETNLE